MDSPVLAYTTIQCFDRHWTARLGTDWERFRLALMRHLRHFHFRHRFGGDHFTSLDGQFSSCFSFSSRLSFAPNDFFGASISIFMAFCIAQC
jgi:hypothetical protein